MEFTDKGDELPNGVSFEDISYLPIVKRFQSHTLGYEEGFIRIQPFNQVFPKCMKGYLSKLSNFNVKESDIWISSFPKCGTTWVQEMVWCLKNNIDIEKAKATILDKRVPFFELTAISPLMPDTFPESMSEVEKLSSPRIIKTHLSFDMLPKQCIGKKLIYIIRNPRDVCVSFFNHWKLLGAYTDTFENFVELFLNDVCGYYAPFVDHVLSYWNRRKSSNLLIISYEEMKEDLPSVIRKVANFLDEEVSSEDVRKLEDHLSFDKMKKNPAVNKQDFLQFANQVYKEMYGREDPPKGEFMQKGEVGHWKEHLTDDLVERFKEWENEGLKNSDLEFVFE